ncbi:MAG: hypothetical protein L5655_07665 [Thermosediminibacteraceae bacterium]|nr:hypothetical protein [Thermosediminibacteraceae bacterium]
MAIDLGHLLASFGGGIIGAAIGGVNAFVMTGMLVLVGVAAGFFGQPQAAAILNSVAFGPVIAPHIAFAGGAAALAYASAKGLDVNGKDATVPLAKLNRPDVLIVGGVFGVLGYLLNSFWVSIALKTDTIALTIILSNMLARALFWKEGPFGTLPDDLKEKGFAGQFVVREGRCWLPWQKDFMQLFVIGLGFGLPAGFVAIATGKPVLAFGIAGAYLVIGQKPGFPVVHHVMLPAALAAQATGSVLMGGVFGVLGALFGELAARLFFNHGKSVIDPPSVAIAILTTIILFM